MVVDRLWNLFLAGFIGFRAIAGLGVAQIRTMLLFTVRMGIDTAMRAMVSRAVGAGDIRLASHVALQGFTLSAVVSISLAVPGVLLTESLLRILGVSEDVIALVANYMRL
jgi:Na+-driven multidrug efflux pump